MIKMFFSTTILLLLVSCSLQQKTHLEIALSLAGENRGELEKVLKRYGKEEKDSLKYKAACFLIENMPYHYYYEGEMLDKYALYYKLLSEKRDDAPASLLDSVQKRYGPFSLQQLQIKYDIQEIDSAYLCENIEQSFYVWQNSPWGKNITFNEFCERILPYRVSTERPTNWKKDFYQRYSPFLVEMENHPEKDNPITAARLLMDSVRKYTSHRYTMVGPPNMPGLHAGILEYATGTCQNITHFTLYVARSLGIPCSEAFMPMKGDVNSDHFWTVYYDNKNELYAQDLLGTLVFSGKSFLRSYPKAKAYIRTYSLNQTISQELRSLSDEIHPLFKYPCYADITSHFSDCYQKSLKIDKSILYKPYSKSKIAYLCLPHFLKWYPVTYTQFDKNNLSFRNIQQGVLMRVATYENGELIFQTPPFYTECSTGELRVISSSEGKEDITLFSKNHLRADKQYTDRMVNGVFEGSNKPDFSEKDTLFLIKEEPYRLLTKAEIVSDKSYRYVRYFGPQDGFCNVAEIAFYKNKEDRLPLKGGLIGTSGAYKDSPHHNYEKAVDGKTDTSFDYKEGYGGWVGLDLGIPTTISHIVYTPRNFDNYVRPGDTYEFFYLEKTWVSMGITISNTDSLHYTNIPTNTLLYLKNHSRGMQERPFTYENGKIQWY